jgi:hypothetical protein
MKAALDKRDLLRPAPPLHLVLKHKGVLDMLTFLGPRQAHRPPRLRVGVGASHCVLVQAGVKVTGTTGVERAIAAFEDVDPRHVVSLWSPTAEPPPLYANLWITSGTAWPFDRLRAQRMLAELVKAQQAQRTELSPSTGSGHSWLVGPWTGSGHSWLVGPWTGSGRGWLVGPWTGSGRGWLVGPSTGSGHN